MQKIIFLLHLPPPIHGSSVVGKYIQDCKEINNEFDCTFINLLASKSVSDTGRINISKLIGFINTWLNLLRLLITQKPSLCYFALTTTGAGFFRDTTFVLLLKLFRVKIVYHLHNKGIKEKNHSFLYRLFYPLAFNDTDVIVLSPLLYEDIRSLVLPEKVHICANGVPLNNYLLSPKKNKVIPELLFLSNLIEEKGVFILLEACEILKNKSIPFHCTFIGSWGDVNEERFNSFLKEKGITNYVKYAGKQYGQTKFEYLRDADIFILPTYYAKECFPMTILEAMSMQLPIVSTPEGGIPDIIEDGITGFLCPQKDASVLAIKLEELILNPTKREEMGKATFTKYESAYTLEIFENRMYQILKSIIATD